MVIKPGLARLGDRPHKFRTDCLWAQHPQIVTVIQVVALLVPARVSALLPPIGDRFRLSTPLHHRCPHCRVPLLEPCWVLAPHPMQDMMKSNRRGPGKPMLGMLRRRVEPSFRTMVIFRAMTTDRLV